ncbi:MAG: helix-turn-helix domain-containing protein, partial [Sulfurimonas sp.]
TMERIVLICPNGVIIPEMLNHVLPFNYQKIYMSYENTPKETKNMPQNTPLTPYKKEEYEESEPKAMITKMSLQEMEKESILKSLIKHRGIQTKAATELGMTARQIGYKIKKYDIDL